MASRFSLNYKVVFTLIFVGVFFILPSLVFAGTENDAYARITMAIIDRYNTTGIEKISDDERVWIAWGVQHEGISARVLRHKEKTWMYDSIQQSAPVYEGVYTWEQGVYDYAHEEKQRALETLGHLLRLTIDMHPVALSASVQGGAHIPTSRTWRDVVEEENTQDTTVLTQEGVDMMRRFFSEAQSTNPKPPFTRTHPLTFFLTRTVSLVQERLTFARINIRNDAERFVQGVHTVFARVPQMSVGGIVASQPPIVAQAQQPKNNEKENIQMNAVAPPQKASVSLPFATSILLTQPESIQPDIPLAVIMPVDAPHLVMQEIPVPTPPQPPLPEVPPAPVATPLPIKPPEVDYLGLPIGYVFHSRDSIPPETTITGTPATVSNAADATFTFSSTEGGKFFCMFDSNAEAECTTPYIVENFLEGQHTFSVRAQDGTGNYDATPATFAWTIDITPPDTTITQSPLALTKEVIAVFTFTASEVDATFGYMLDGGAWQETTSPLTLSNFMDGQHTVMIRSTDGAGNVDPTPTTIPWTIDTLAPVAPTLVSPTTGVSYTTVASTVTLTGTREDGATIAMEGSSDGVTTPTGATWEKSITLALGTTTLSFTATDAAGNISAPFVIALTRTGNHAPTAITNLAITTPITTNDRLALTWTAPSDVDIPSQALIYILRYATTPITDEATWNTAMDVASPPSAGVAGASETFTVTGLSPATTYYFAVRTFDGELLSSLSNTPSGTTHYGVRITNWDASAEYIVIKNERSDPQPLEGWTLFDAATTPHTYPFDASFILAAGATVTIHTVAVTDTNTQTDLYWVHSPVWNNDHDTAFLKDSSGTLIDSVSW